MHESTHVVVVKRVLLSQIITLVGYSALCGFCLLLLAYLRVNRHVALTGNAQATRKVILPAFEPLLWILAGATGVYALFFCVALEIKLYTTSFPIIDSEIFYAGRQFVFVLGLVFLRQKSMSLPALRRAVAISVLLASYTVPVIWGVSRSDPDNTAVLFIAKLTMRPLLLIFVVWVCFIRPPVGRASSFSLRIHGAYVITYHVLISTNNVLQWVAPNSDVFPATSYMVVTWGSLSPLFIWGLLRADTECWRGMGERVWSLQHVNHQAGQVSQLEVSESILSSGIHDLIEVHRKFLIDFAHLEIMRKIGEGSSASVFSGRLRKGMPVAVKVYTPYRFTEEVVAEFSHEAALCVSLNHPNVVKFYGMCVSPPTIGLVFEFCQGSLEDILYAQAKTSSRHRGTKQLVNVGGVVTDVRGCVQRQQMVLNVAYMLDCARALAYIHSFSPPLLHRDIKPANFLVDNFSTVKLTDFGDSRRLPHELPQKIRSDLGSDPQTSVGALNSSAGSTTGATTPRIKMTVTGTVSYMAPELISSRTGLATYGEAADIYSLAITFWDILYPDREKYPVTNNNPLLVFEGVLSGCRPAFDDTDWMGHHEAPCPKLLQLIASSWHSDPNMRPTMPQIVRQLESIQEELLAVLAQDLSEDCYRSCSRSTEAPPGRCFSGEFMTERMENLQVTGSRSESVRLGRALMDAGFLHHLRHTQGFEATSTTYFFDDGNINLCQPVAMLEASADTSPESEDEAFSYRSNETLAPVLSQSKKSSRPSRLFSHLASTFIVNSQSSSGTNGGRHGAEEVYGCACRVLGQCHNLPTINRRSDLHHRQSRMRAKSAPRRLSQSQQLQSTCSSSSSNATRPASPTKRKRGSEDDQGGTLTQKLLDEEQHYSIEISDEEMLEPISLAQRAA